MNRRKFLMNSGSAGVAVSLLGLYACKQKTEKPSDLPEAMASADPFFKLSLAQWSIHRMIWDGSVSPMDFAAKASGWGFEGLEYVSQLYAKELEKYSGAANPMEQLVKELKKRSDDHGMKNQIMMVDLPEEEGVMATPDQTLRKAGVENHFKWVDATAGLGCHSMRVNLFGSKDPEVWKENSIASLTELSEYAAKQNVNVIVENHGWLSSDAALLAEVLTAVGMDNCGTLPDFGNFCVKRDGEGNWGGDCVEEYDMYQGVGELMPFAKGVSAKSYDFNAKGNETKIDYLKMMKIVKDAGYTGYVGVEYEGDRLSEEEGILATKALLLKVAGELA
ncbi:sugar phosphate isomerase/epimerase family protein [Robertkochia solimangrovi]|uniref:sugar phosphate isomerase/epimerase family protein n=1 Tax=Robertkochia solimangrovi TaxID=2213046 RepID=UPI0011810B8E|nr:TIM barrel protein [Robertkochia solimangrovi]TRZ46282.1 sugar phosphate isomerase/epimerase [Robertkochia solimangrovi]